MGNLVLDSSALITLAQADALSQLALSPHRAVTITAVYKETVTQGGDRIDARRIASAFVEQIVKQKDPEQDLHASRPSQD